MAPLVERCGIAETLSTLRRIDASIEEVIATATHATLYNYGEEWERGAIEGPLFVCRSPKGHILIVLNRLSIENLVEMVESLEFEIVDRYLIFRKNGAIRGLWFHDIDEHANIAQLLQRISIEAPDLLTPAVVQEDEVDLTALRAAMLDLVNDDAFLLEFHKIYQAKRAASS
ncbi:hypothetical protein CTAYLR_010327 [Chrysophaeum taylorii]|uniref:mRNA-decapping enzyme-like protein n=1 Tax=Chrysophaeum taylorii TaxID=2483200 RepID=A0AAD7UIM5_9STRA|nr:hypothetical protein CTAYLR_010327 [Chrysophaeum taylorii]